MTKNKLSVCDPKVRDDTALHEPAVSLKLTWHCEFPWPLSGHIFLEPTGLDALVSAQEKLCLSQKLAVLLKHMYHSRVSARSPSIHTHKAIISCLHMTERWSL